MRIRDLIVRALDRPRAGESRVMWQMRRMREISEGSTLRILHSVAPDPPGEQLGEDPIGPITGARLVMVDLRDRGARGDRHMDRGWRRPGGELFDGERAITDAERDRE